MANKLNAEINADPKGFNKGTKEAEKRAKNFGSGVEKVGKGISASFLKITLVVGAIVGAFKAFRNILGGTVDGQERLAAITGMVNGVLTVLKDTAIDAVDALMKAFEDPQQAVKDLWGVIKNNLINRFTGFIDLVVSGWETISAGARGVGQAVAGIFSKDKREQSKQSFKEMREGLADMGHAALQVATGIEDVIEKVGQMAEGVRTAGKRMSEVAKASAQLERDLFQLRRKEISDRLKVISIEQEISKLRVISNDQQKSLNERLEAQTRAMELVEEKQAIQIANAKERIEIQKAQMALGHNQIEDEEKLGQLEGNLLMLQRQQNEETRALLEKFNTLRNEKNKGFEDEKKARAEIIQTIEDQYKTELQLHDEMVTAQLEAFQWSEEEKTKLLEHYALQRQAIIDNMEPPEDENLDEVVEKYSKLEDAAKSWGDQVQSSAAEGIDSVKSYGKAVADSAKKTIKAYLAETIAAAVRNAMGAGPLGIFLAGAAGAAAAGIFNAAIPAFAQGGAVSGPTMALVGEAPGISKSNPEYIGTAKQLGQMGVGSSGGGTAKFLRISQGDLIFAINESQAHNSRSY